MEKIQSIKLGLLLGTVLLTSLCLGMCGEPEQKLELTITDESNLPIEGVACKAWLNHSGTTSPLDTYVVSGKTDSRGVVVLQGETVRYQTACEAQAPGYYRSSAGGLWIRKQSGNRWEPWPVKIEFVLRKKINPHPMYAYRPAPDSWVTFPQSDLVSFGFDLIKRDWVRPYGQGIVADFVLSTRSGIKKEGELLPQGTMSLSFSNPGDGIISVIDAPTEDSDLMSPREAPLTGYAKEFLFSSRPTQDGLFLGTKTARRVWMFRVRSKVDGKGEVLSALYGKIQGHPDVLLFSRGHAFEMTYYINNRRNDRNLEWDLKNNLFKDLDFVQWPEYP